MIRTSRQHAKQVIVKLALHRETVRTLGDSELAALAGGHGPNCTADSAQISTCIPLQLDAAAPTLLK